ncbi:MAG: M48 family metalloprotease [Saprospiraceae bacterium]|nr:M48 family metalloprotease [Saprospiraceae bacterium]
MNLRTLILLFTLSLFAFSCSKEGGFNIFSIEDDVQLGMQLKNEVLGNPQEYPLLDRSQYPAAYAFVEDIVNDILASGQITYQEEFAWEVYLIDDGETLNAFAAPGGYIFVYTGLIKFLDMKDDLVGVLGHEMAHADQRHSTEQLSQVYGISFLLDLLLGDNQSILTDVLATLVTLKFSRDDESEADEYSVIYLCETEYAANSAASFFQKLIEQGAASPPQFLSTHPNPDNRIENINMLALERGCDTSFDSSQSAWENFQKSLP